MDQDKMECRDHLGSNDSEKEPTKKEVGRRWEERKRLRASCVLVLQEHWPPPEVLPQYEENVDYWCRLLRTSSLKEGAV
jgi:hypothetical protein